MFIQLSSHRQSTTRQNKRSINRYCHKQTKKIKLYFDNDNNNGTGQYISSSKNENYHRVGAPACIIYFKSGNIQYEGWIKNGEYHRPAGAPAVMTYFENGTINEKTWYINGIRQ